MLASFNTSVSIAICYWGLTRSVRLGTSVSHANHVVGVLNMVSVDYRIFLHTWEPPDGRQRVWYSGDEAGQRGTKSTPVDYEEWRLLAPHVFRRDNQTIFEQTLRSNWAAYHGGESAWDAQLTMNCLCAVESIRRV